MLLEWTEVADEVVINALGGKRTLTATPEVLTTIFNIVHSCVLGLCTNSWSNTAHFALSTLLKYVAS